MTWDLDKMRQLAFLIKLGECLERNQDQISKKAWEELFNILHEPQADVQEKDAMPVEDGTGPYWKPVTDSRVALKWLETWAIRAGRTPDEFQQVWETSVELEIMKARLEAGGSARERLAEILKKELPEYKVLIDRIVREHKYDEF